MAAKIAQTSGNYDKKVYDSGDGDNALDVKTRAQDDSKFSSYPKSAVKDDKKNFHQKTNISKEINTSHSQDSDRVGKSRTKNFDAEP